MANPHPSKPFSKGDPRINRKGRPKDFKALRELALQIAHEQAISKGEPLVINGRKVTLTEVILRRWATSDNPVLQKAYMEIAFGKVPDETILDLKGEIPVRVYIPENHREDDNRNKVTE